MLGASSVVILGLDQISDFSWDEPNSYLGQPKLSNNRLLGQTLNQSTESDQKAILAGQWYVFSRMRLNIHYHTNFVIY